VADERSQTERWVSFAAGIVAPVTLISGLLFYFGYVSARSEYEYFGVDVDTIGLNTRDYVMRSPQPLLVPLLVITLIAVAGLLLHNAIQPTSTGLRRAKIAAVLFLLLGVLALIGYPLLDTNERLQSRSPGLEETSLRPGAGQTFNYRYRGLRLLAVGQNRLFLVPQRWNASNTTLVVPLDGSIRVQFQFQNDPP
jgi:hypothetical protein